MADITATMVKNLRERTGAGMMDCKKALVECSGDMDKAIDFLREKGLAAAAKKAGRIAAEGIVGSYVSADAKVGVIIEVNCETDFVAKTDNFKNLVNGLAKYVADSNPTDVNMLLKGEIEPGKTAETFVNEAIAKIGEKINVRRFIRIETDGMISDYIHGGGKIGVLVNIKGGTAELGKDIAMQVAAANPGYLKREEVPTAELEHEKIVLAEQARNEGKPEKIIEKMVMGRIQKFYKEVCLIEQEFVKDPDITITKLLTSKNAEIIGFARFQMGEGLEKRNDDFAAEVMAQVNG